ncbi:endonuclease [Marinobacter litoralis]|nr:endonuclease [Marinobacter litoralis]
MKLALTSVLTLLTAITHLPNAAADTLTFRKAKELSREVVYEDQSQALTGTFYCGCSWSWAGKSGGRIDHLSCNYGVRKQENRAARLEWEHVVPAWVMGHQRQCWKEGGRRNCRSNDPLFSVMEADMHNLVPAIGEVNGDRSNYKFGVISGEPRAYGHCDVEIDFKERVVEPRPEVRGQIARTYFYIHDRYNLSMSKQQQQLFMAWHKQFPVTPWELERSRRIAQVTGVNNPFVTGEQSWKIGHKNSGSGLSVQLAQSNKSKHSESDPRYQEVRGNRNSKVFHLSVGCPSYDRVSPKNRVSFTSEAEAVDAGYRKAGNCR